MKIVRILNWGLAVAFAQAAGCSTVLWPDGSETGVPVTFTAALPETSTPASLDPDTATPAPFELDLTPLPTPTALPTISLPTAPAFLQDIQVWDGLPTYPADSRPELYFRVRYDPKAWGLTRDQFGNPALGHRSLAGCVLAPAAGGGLPQNSSVDHQTRQIGGLTFQVAAISIGGTLQSIVYAGGDGGVYTGFELRFGDEAEACIAAGEAVVGTLRSVLIIESTPVTGP